jgi:Ca2+-dependent lipid-binding protein
MLSDGTATSEFMGKETTKELPAESQEVMESILPLDVLYNLGLLPSEVGSEIRYITKIAKKTGKTEKQKESAKKKKEKEEKESKRRKRRVRKTRKRPTRTR